MKILLVNYHYFIRGGPDRYFFNVKDALEKEGHTIVPFAFDYADTIETPYRKYFPEPITGRGPCLLSELSLSASAKVKAALRMFHNGEVNRRFREIVETVRPDVVFSVYLSSTLLPNILKIAKEEFGLPVVYRLSDFHMFCASYLFYRDGITCTDCLDRQWSAVRHGCVHQSKCASTLRVLQLKYFRYRKWYDAVDVFACPSKLMADFLVRHGIQSEKVTYLPTFAKDLSQDRMCAVDPPYVLYFGRINQVKGAEVLVKAFNAVDRPRFGLRMVGHVEPEYRQVLLDYLDNEHKHRVEILAPQEGEELARTIRQALFVVHPAMWLENMPNALLEAMSAGKAIITSNLGSLPELVQHGINGLLVQSGDTRSLANAIVDLSCRKDLDRMGRQSRELYEKEHTAQQHMSRLLGVFDRLLARQECPLRFHAMPRTAQSMCETNHHLSR
jgi:glycosyltransferase involved in cell wall biosynthesis